MSLLLFKSKSNLGVYLILYSLSYIAILRGMFRSANHSSLYVMTVFSITIIIGRTISSVSGAPSTTTAINSTYSLSNLSSSTLLTAQKENNNSTSAFEITDQIKALINDRLDKNNTNSAIAIGFVDQN